MDTESVLFRAQCLRAVRDFFLEHLYIELDTPALARALVPERCLEVFQTEYFTSVHAKDTQKLYLVPSPEVFLKPLIAQLQRSAFQISKCYRNGESMGALHRPEFTMVEYYTVYADYKTSLDVSSKLFRFVVEQVQSHPLADPYSCACFCAPFEYVTVEEAFLRYAGFSLSHASSVQTLAQEVLRSGIDLGARAGVDYTQWSWDDLYELLLVHIVEPKLRSIKDRCVVLYDYPIQISCLAQEHTGRSGIQSTSPNKGDAPHWVVKERWELYVRGVELINCYTEQRDAKRVTRYCREEQTAKQGSARVVHPVPEGFAHACARMPPCSGAALGFDRLVALLAGRHSLDAFVYDQ
ncbi:lysine--tRNA ligase [Treponema paraluiscuniculi Cuniculi A]|uniref:Lysine--tRNA ligase n=2 Tax=Treponema paraluiscuniculi TaxID=53435 RepID=F7XRA8_TREPU|nr:amino acid--tRNA ligase-related protein [Treponema paraluiscuniculi]AEH40967.1 lysine--tRNA ligase [Treponema paraluiscuniculi Cuniculi A]WKC72895.1 lysine--tRNA ligase [Treponema paraluiscuniculi]